MDRRSFLKTMGVGVGAVATGFGVATHGADHEVVAAEEVGGVELLTDELGVTHVYGDTLYDVGYGQGYVQARDRLFQLDLLRSIGRGELAAIIGPSELSEDVSTTRDLYTDEELETQWENAAEDVREMIRGYTDGVNHQLDRLKSRGELPGEFTLLARRPRAWRPTDTVAAITYMIGRFGVSTGAGLSNFHELAALFDRVEGENADVPDIFPDRAAAWEAYGDIDTVEVPDEHYGSVLASEIDQHADGATPTGERALDFEEVPEAQLDLLDIAGETRDWSVDESAFDGFRDVFGFSTGLFAGSESASNAIIVAGEHTETGKPMLGGGPQMGLFKPPVIHEIGIHGADFDVVGAGVVGTPGIVVGRTPEFAWTVTTSGDDMSERVAVDLDPDDHTRYRWDGEWHDLVTEQHVHEPNLWAGLVDGNLDTERIEQEVAFVEQEGIRMPVIDYHPEEHLVIVDRVATRMDELDGAFKWADIGRASNQEEFEERLSEFPFGFNFHYIDDEGIAYYRTGKLPRRRTDADSRFPTPEAYHGWNGFHEGILAAVRDPDRGYVVNWNNATAPGWRNSTGSFGWDGPHRTEIMDRLTREGVLRTDPAYSLEDAEGLDLPADAQGNLSLEDVEGIIEDCSVEQPFAPRFVPHLVAAARQSNDDQLHAMADELEQWAEADDLERFAGPETLAQWVETRYSFRPGEEGRYPDGGMAIFEAVSHALLDLVFGDVLGPRAPTLDFDPTGGGFAGSDHAADHGSSSGIGLVIDTLEESDRFAFEWLADYREAFELANAATGEALALDVASGWWGWLWDDDEITLGETPTAWTAPAADSGHLALGADRPCHLRAATTDHAVETADDGPGAALAPVTGEDGAVFAFRQVDDGTYRVENTASGLALQAAGDSVCQQRPERRPDQHWSVRSVALAGREDLLQAAMRAAAEELEGEFGTDDPAEWRMDARQSEFGTLGGASGEQIPMTNRASYQQSIAIGEGTGSERDLAKSVMPPSNTGHLNLWELIAVQFGQEPDRLTDQLDTYVSFGYTPQPVTREGVTERVEERRDLG